MEKYLIRTPSGNKGPYTKRVVLKGLAQGKIPPTATLVELQTGRNFPASELMDAEYPQPPVAYPTIEPRRQQFQYPQMQQPMARPPMPVSQAGHNYRGRSQTIVNVHRGDQTTPMMAVAGFVCAWFCWPLGLIFSIVGLQDAKKRGGAGAGLAMAGLVLSVLGALITLLIIVVPAMVVREGIEQTAPR